MATSDRTRDPLSVRRLIVELDAALRIAEAAAEACRLREITPHLIDLLDAAGYETRPREPGPDVWLPEKRSR